MIHVPPKPASRSLTVQSGIATTLSGFVATAVLWGQDPANYQKAAGCLNAFGLTEQADAVLKVAASLPMIFGLLTIYGRVRAKRPIGKRAVR